MAVPLIVGVEQPRLAARRILVVVAVVAVAAAAVGSTHHNQQFVHSPEVCDWCSFLSL